MQSTTSLISKIKLDYSHLLFKLGSNFSWSSSDRTITYNKSDLDCNTLLLHELSHALLNHNGYDSDIQLISIERSTWDKTIELAKKYDVDMPKQIVETILDSYRDWLHLRSSCPKCNANGLQDKNGSYLCLACNKRWRVNEARLCALRRYNA